jgi:Golgi apparatus protein 1
VVWADAVACALAAAAAAFCCCCFLPLLGGKGSFAQHVKHINIISSQKGPCGPEKKAFCKDVDAGEGRLAACLTARIAAERKGNVAGRAVLDACVDAVAEFKIERSNNVNADVPLARACKDDAAKICGGQNDKASPGSVVACLRGNTRKLAPACAKQVLRAQLEAADDYRLDARLRGACEASVKTLCADVEPGDGRELDCLADKSKQLKWDCLEQVVRFQKEASDDIRLSVRLFRRCLGDQKKFCADVEPGHMRVQVRDGRGGGGEEEREGSGGGWACTSQHAHATTSRMHAAQHTTHKQECLEDNMDAPDFSAGCRKDLEDALAKRVADFRCVLFSFEELWGFLMLSRVSVSFCVGLLCIPYRFANPLCPVSTTPTTSTTTQTKH